MRLSAIILMVAFAVLTSVSRAGAQKLAIGGKSPEIQVGEWLTGSPSDGKPQLIDFLHSSSHESVSLLAEMNGYALKYSDKLNVIIIAREAKDKVKELTLKGSPKYYVALDDGGKTFTNFSVKVVPFSVVTDSKGNVLWFGNPSQLNTDMLDGLLK